MRICFVATLPGMLPLLTGERARESGGGVQVQLSLLGRALADAGHKVSFVVADPADGDSCEEQPADPEIRIIHAYDRTRSDAKLARAMHRAGGLWTAMRRADAEAYILQGAGALAAVILHFCRRNRRTFVFWAASATDALCCVPGHSRVKRGQRWLTRRGIRGADAIIAQTEDEARDFRVHMGREAAVIPNVWRTDDTTPPAPLRAAEGLPDGYVLWVSNIRPEKRPDMALDIAQRLADVPMVMVGGPVRGHEALYAQMAARASGLPNVTFCGLVDFSAMPGYFERATLLLNTSSVEGYPNTYLQAWAARLPVVGTFDPDEVMCRFGIGLHCGDIGDTVSAISELMSDSVLRAQMGQRGHDYLREHHDINVVLPRLESALRDAISAQ